MCIHPFSQRGGYNIRQMFLEVRGRGDYNGRPEGVDSIGWSLRLADGVQVPVGDEVPADEGGEHRSDIGLNVGIDGGAGVRFWCLQTPSGFGSRFWLRFPTLTGRTNWVRVVQPVLMGWIIFGVQWG